MGVEDILFGNDVTPVRMILNDKTNEYSLSIAFCDRLANKEDYDAMLNVIYKYFANHFNSFGEGVQRPTLDKPHNPFGYVFKNEELTAKFEYKEFDVRIKPFVRFLLCYTGKDKLSINDGLNFLIREYSSLKEPFVEYYDLSEIDGVFENFDIEKYLEERSKERSEVKIPIGFLEQTKEVQVQKPKSEKFDVRGYELSKQEIEFFGKYYPQPITQDEAKRFKDKFNRMTAEELRNNEDLKAFNKFINALLSYKRSDEKSKNRKPRDKNIKRRD